MTTMVRSRSVLRRLLLTAAAAALTVVGVGLGPAHADGTEYWSISYQAGNASGQFTSNAPADYWHVSGKITDSTANTSCSYFRVRVYSINPLNGLTEVYRKQVCGGARATYDVAGYSRAADKIQISVCSNLIGFSDPCSSKWLYLT